MFMINSLQLIESIVHHAQRTGRGLGIKHNPGLFQYPSLDALMVHAQQV
jgi:hypothetical protein